MTYLFHRITHGHYVTISSLEGNNRTPEKKKTGNGSITHKKQ